MYSYKKKWFSGVQNMTIVTPSNWLAGLVNESFLQIYPVKVINNGIDLDTFKPRRSDFRKENCLLGKVMLLGVALTWNKSKGLDVLVDLAQRLGEHYCIVLVGVTNDVKKFIPNNIVSIERTMEAKRLAEIYTAADIFINPTREETFPFVNLEALACGTPVLTSKTGGSPESIDETCGMVVDFSDLDIVISTIEDMLKMKISEEACRRKAETYNQNNKYMEYMQLYEEDV
jgi:glycosyltransferase involved in cell wall biosynthesis